MIEFRTYNKGLCNADWTPVKKISVTISDILSGDPTVFLLVNLAKSQTKYGDNSDHPTDSVEIGGLKLEDLDQLIKALNQARADLSAELLDRDTDTDTGISYTGKIY